MNKTQEKQLENIIVAYSMMLAIPPRRIIPTLHSWSNDVMRTEGAHHCGSAACFGGWVAQEPHFQAMGVWPDYAGSPTMGVLTPGQIGQKLFGDYTIFAPRDDYGNEGPGTDKQIILRRLEKAADALLGVE